MIIIMVRENLSFPCMYFMKTILAVMMARGWSQVEEKEALSSVVELLANCQLLQFIYHLRTGTQIGAA